MYVHQIPMREVSSSFRFLIWILSKWFVSSCDEKWSSFYLPITTGIQWKSGTTSIFDGLDSIGQHYNVYEALLKLIYFASRCQSCFREIPALHQVISRMHSQHMGLTLYLPGEYKKACLNAACLHRKDIHSSLKKILNKKRKMHFLQTSKEPPKPPKKKRIFLE